MKKQKEIGRKQRKAFRKNFLPFVFSLRFLLELSALAGITFLAYSHNFKSGFFVLMMAIVGVELSKLAYGGFKKFSNRSLNMQMAVSASPFVMQMPYLSVMLFNWYYEDTVSKPYFILFILGFVLFAISRHGLNIYIKTYKTYKERFELLVA
jgi:NADH:ubiquinone oxidoreductase subunit K